MHAGRAYRSGPANSSHSVGAEPFDRAQDRRVEAGAALRQTQGERWWIRGTQRAALMVQAASRKTMGATRTVQAEPVKAPPRTPLERVQSQGERLIHQGAQAIAPGGFITLFAPIFIAERHYKKRTQTAFLPIFFPTRPCTARCGALRNAHRPALALISPFGSDSSSTTPWTCT